MDENGNTIIKTKPRTGARRVLVTGGAGFVGSHLCDALVARGDYVICLGTRSAKVFSCQVLFEHTYRSFRAAVFSISRQHPKNSY
mmetsp:Transcript_1808/g.6507  ORF Transcript_1808/g.6507 Transcript_1808/m.6507 type:complete len:85 (-) Transcript_1808:1893-2147(-)